MRLLAAIWFAVSLFGSDCRPTSLNDAEKLQLFKKLDGDAQGALERRDYEAAVRSYQEAACIAPKSARAFYGLGTAEAAAGDLVAARQALETARDLLPGNVLPLTMLVRVNVALKDTARVKQILRTAAERFPNDAEFHSAIARFLAENQLLDLALAESLRFEQTGSNNLDATLALAVLENTVGAYVDALRNAAAIEENTTSPAALRASAAGVAGLSYESLGKTDAAIKELSKAIEWAPQENSYLALAFVYERAQRYSEAVAILEQAHKRLAGSTALLLALGSDLVRGGEFDRGEQVLNELLRQDPTIAEAYARLAEAYRATHRPELELEALRKLGRLKPDYPMIHVLMAQVMMSAEPVDYGKVLEELERAEKATPTDPDIFYLRGKVYIAQNRLEDAVAALKRAIELRPTETGPYYQLGMVYRKLSRPDLARETLARVKELNDKAAGR